MPAGATALEKTMSSSSVANTNLVLANIKDQRTQPLAPTDAILRALRDRQRVALPELSEVTGLSPTVCFETVEKLRAQELVEIVEVAERDQKLYIQLTSRGYASFLPK